MDTLLRTRAGKVRGLASDELTDTVVLAELSTHKDDAVRQMIALNPATPFDVLVAMVRHDTSWHVAWNAARSIAVERYVAKYDTRWNVAGYIESPYFLMDSNDIILLVRGKAL